MQTVFGQRISNGSYMMSSGPVQDQITKLVADNGQLIAHTATGEWLINVEDKTATLIGGCITPREPLIHSHISDVLPPDHPLANTAIHCTYCGTLLHASNNECMQTWIEVPIALLRSGNYCVSCFGGGGFEVLEERGDQQTTSPPFDKTGKS